MEKKIISIWPEWEEPKMIGRGSFGAVYKIQRNVFGNTEEAALKVISIPQNAGDIDSLYDDGYDDESIRSTFQSHLKSIVAEYTLMRKLNGCANIVNCDDVRYVQHDDGIGWDIFIKMELLTPLAKTLPTRISEETVIKIAKDMCNALIVCKKYGVIHRDVKPQNIFLSPHGDYKLGDFGIAKTVEQTMGGTKTGTYNYMAPEVYSNQPYGTSADIYSLGLVLYWLLNERRLPFLPLPPEKLYADMDRQARERRFSGEAIPTPEHGSCELKSIVRKACAFNPKDRYVSAAAMLEDLNKLTIGAESMGTAVIDRDNRTGDPIISVANSAAPTDAPVVDSPVVTSEMKRDKKTVAEQYDSDVSQEGKIVNKLPILKCCLAAFGVMTVVLLILLLRFPGGEKSNSAEIIPTASSQTIQQNGWSKWVEELPEYVNEIDYEIKEDILYSSQDIETTSSTETDSMDGWELVDTVESDGGFGPWSEWSEIPIESTPTRKVETEIRYRYQDKETTTGSSPSKDGWTLYDTTYSWGDYGSWSGWFETPVAESDSRKVKTKLQYQYKDSWTTQEVTGWNAPGEWTFERHATNDQIKEESRTVYGYCYFQCPYCGDHMHGWGQCWTWADGCGATTTDGNWHEVWSEIPWDQAGLMDWHGTGKYYTHINGERVFKWPEGGTRTQYRYATQSVRDVTHEGSWSDWEDTEYTASATREVRTRTVYSYCDREQIAIYHFYRWGDLSDWSKNSVSATNDRRVESKMFYQYCDQMTEKTYYFRRLTDWSEYTDEEVVSSDMVNVKTKKVYSYKPKSD